MLQLCSIDCIWLCPLAEIHVCCNFMRVIVSSHKCWLCTTVEVYSEIFIATVVHTTRSSEMFEALCECDVYSPCQCIPNANNLNVCVAASIYCSKFLTFFSVGLFVFVFYFFMCVLFFCTVKPHGRPDGWVPQNDVLPAKSCPKRTKLRENGAIVGHFNLCRK